MLCLTSLIKPQRRKFNWEYVLKITLVVLIGFFMLTNQGCGSFEFGPQKPTTLHEMNSCPCPVEDNFIWGNPPPAPTPEPTPEPEDDEENSTPARIPFHIHYQDLSPASITWPLIQLPFDNNVVTGNNNVVLTYTF